MAKSAPLPFSGYVRISRVGDRAGDSFISPDVQRDTINRLASFHGVAVDEIVEELDVSGGKPIEEREVGRLVRKVETGESGGLVVWKVSRFSRNLVDGVTTADRVRKAGGRIIGEDLDSDAPMGRAILGFLLGYAEEELDARRAGWREAQRRAAERGVYPSRQPVGYVKDDEGRLMPDPATAATVTEIFRMRAAGASYGACATYLQEHVGSAGRSSVRDMLANRVYLGRIVHGAEGSDDFIYVEEAHPALIDLRTWELAQRSGAPVRRTGSLAGKGVLLGLVTCAACGQRLTTVASGPPGARFASYTCRKYRAASVCPKPATARIDAVDALVLPELEKRASTLDLERALVELHHAQEVYAAASRELDEFLAAGLVSALGPELYAREVARRREAVTTTAAAYREALDAQGRLAATDTDGIEGRRELARRVIASATLSKSTRGRWQPIEERLEVVWQRGAK